MGEKKYEAIPGRFWIVVIPLMSISAFVSPWLGFGLAFITFFIDKYRPR